MNPLLIPPLAVALGCDAFAVSVAIDGRGPVTAGQKSRLSFGFGLFQFLMPLLGCTAGISLVRHLENWGHWIAFPLLTAFTILISG